jgi:hypothetical protein
MKAATFVYLAAAAALAAAAPAHAQDPMPIEFGVDAGLTVGTESPRVTTFSLPVQRLRVGFFLSPALSLEPAILVNRTSTTGLSVSGYEADLGILWHFTPPAPGTRTFYARPFAGISGFSASFEGERVSDSELNAGIGLGVRLPLADRLQARIEAQGRHQFDSDVQTLGLSAGISFLTR